MTQPPKVNKVKRAAQSIFLAPNGMMPDAQKTFLGAMAKFCAAGRSPRSIGAVGIDTNATMMMVGRQEVWCWLNNLINIPDRDIAQMAITDIPPTDGE